jgi:hypothetical protein
VDGTYSLSAGAGGIGFFGSGPASLTFDWVGDWIFDSGFARIGSPGPTRTPEPTTLLLLGTTAAGLGLAGWRRRGASGGGVLHLAAAPKT